MLSTMPISELLCFLILLQTLLHPSPTQAAINSNLLFRDYIGADSDNTRFFDVPVEPGVEFHFILSFAIDYTQSNSSPTNGNFNTFWNTEDLTPLQVRSIKSAHRNVRVALSLGGDTVTEGQYAYFAPLSVKSWVRNAVSSLTQIIRVYGLDGIDVDYEHFQSSPRVFAECIGQLVTTLKKNGIIKFASIAPYEDDEVQSHYLALWKEYGDVIDYVNFQFYAYEKGTNVSEFLGYFNEQSANYKGGKVLVSLSTEQDPGGLTPENGFFSACRQLMKEGKLHGIFIWSADDSKKMGFKYERQSQVLLSRPFSLN